MIGPLAAPTGRREVGAVGGIEVLPFAILVFVAGALLVGSLWSVVDAKVTVTAAAREAGRSYVESDGSRAAAAAADLVALEVVRGAGRDADRVVVARSGRFERCAAITTEVQLRVPLAVLPFVGRWGDGVTVHGRDRSTVDPYRSGLHGAARC